MKKLSAKKKQCLGAFAAAAMVGTPVAANASDYTQLTDGKETVHIYEVTQQEGVQMVQDFNLTTTLEHGTNQYYRERTRYITERVEQDMRNQGYSEAFANIFSQFYGSAFSRVTYNGQVVFTFDENNPRPFNGSGPVAMRLPGLDPNYCAIVSASPYSSQAWVQDWMRIDLDNPDTIPSQFGNMFTEFANYHERAHCFGASEPEADYIAALQMLRDYQDQPQLVESFLWVQSGIRNFKALQSTDFYTRYLMTGTFSQLAIANYNAAPELYDTDEKIYALRDGQLPTELDFIRNAHRSFDSSLAYLETMLGQSLCEVPQQTVKVSYSSPQCR